MGRIAVFVTPRASRDAIEGWRGEELAVRVTAPPDDGKANAAVERLLARRFGVPKSSVAITRGQTSRHKIVEVSGLDRDQLMSSLHVID